ncbi:E3 ubiquitin-protein ligase UHRF1 isoform X1 [Acyrthosiphon pisum]|uniref:RING-type E3 ubiquitin transferase n=2 Tax=Acyrthosiphon pisum TaxID=7029 RepID=A0A8R1VZS3_ACYPI|nr:E3 ubiquitin-protein ligase UHRF1 isoform X1 [Acyrthosiphon pisum]|eukprot:XP_001945737.1 PREDICTED: E3 ubiquitin-protein ligase UHRF1 isoform X1 [Acyrthosiphon pisum]
MYVQVRMMDTGVSVTIPTSRTTVLKEFKKLVEEKFNIKPENQRLFFAGKQLEDQYRLFDYSINVNDVIQLMVRAAVAESNSPKKSKVTINSIKETSTPCSSSTTSSTLNEDNSEESKYFKVGDYVDVKDYTYGSWFISKLIKIKKDSCAVNKPNDPKSPVENDGLVYVAEILRCPEEPPIEVQLQEIRPHAFDILPFEKLKTNDRVLMNYNVDYPQERGYWYDVLVKEIKTNRRGRDVIGDVSVGLDNAVLKNCHLMFLDDIYIVKPYQLLSERTPEDDKIIQTEPAVMRAAALYCIKCKDNLNKSCKECGCRVCGGKDNEDKQLMCDECNHPYHMECLTPPLKEMPRDDWYCPSCKNDENEIVKAGEKLKVSKKKTPESMSTSKRDWGKGMACVGRTKKCNIVPSNHFGPIPGVEVGTTWLFRVQVSEAGIHRPPVGGIHGRDNQGAFSIVLSGGYEDDVDNGDEFLYTGSGGRDLSGNKRTALQSCDQELTRYNRALALNCNAKIDSEKGATAVDWKKGKPVRVVRNYKLCKHSKYAPDLGNRYDGLYKVIKYYPETGISGFTVWRFVLRRDDPTPAPWTAQGKKRIAQLGLKLIYPENYIPAVTNDTKSKLPGSKRKRTLQDADIEDNEQCKNNDPKRNSSEREVADNPEKKSKICYELEKEAETLITADVANTKYWEDCKEYLEKGKKAFLDRVEEMFSCICCQEIVFEPITTECSHNICKGCLRRSFNADVFQCPSCRAELGKSYPMNVNVKLAKTLLFLFPGYNLDR